MKTVKIKCRQAFALEMSSKSFFFDQSQDSLYSIEFTRNIYNAMNRVGPLNDRIKWTTEKINNEIQYKFNKSNRRFHFTDTGSVLISNLLTFVYSCMNRFAKAYQRFKIKK